MAKKDLPPAVIAGFEANGLGVARPLFSAGVPVIAVGGPEWNPAHLSRSARVERLKSWSKAPFIEKLSAIGAGLSSPAPLIPTKDEAVLWISEERERLGKYYSLALPPHERIIQLLDKNSFYRLACDRGWPVPRSWSISSLAQLNAVLEEITFPVILKPQIKNQAFRESWLPKAFRAAGRSELLSAYERVAPHEPDVIIQQWIEGGDDRIAFILGCWDRDSKPLALFSGRKLRQWPLDHGNTAAAEPAQPQWAAEMDRLCSEIAPACNFQGLNSIEFKVEAGSDKFYITEPTVSRSDYQSEVAVMNGVNLPLIYYSAMIGLAVQQQSGRQQERPAPVRWVDCRADRKARLALERLERTGEMQSGTAAFKKEYIWFRWSDMLPWFGTLLPQWLRRRL